MLVASSLEKLQNEYDLSLHWHAFELRPAGSPPMPPEYLKRIEAGRPMLQRRAREEYGIELNVGPMGINSRPALVGEQYARAQGLGNEYHDAVMHAYWREAKSIDDLQLLKEIAVGVGLDGEQFLAALKQPEYEATVDADVEMAHEYGLDAVPALILGDKYLVMGAQPYAVLKQAVEQAQKEGL